MELIKDFEGLFCEPEKMELASSKDALVALQRTHSNLILSICGLKSAPLVFTGDAQKDKLLFWEFFVSVHVAYTYLCRNMRVKNQFDWDSMSEVV